MTVKLYTIKFFLESTGESFSIAWIEEEVETLHAHLTRFMAEIIDEMSMGEGTFQDMINEVEEAILHMAENETYRHHLLQVTVTWRKVQLR